MPLITRDGVYAKIGTLTTGSGTAFGVGYRSRRFLGRDFGFDAWAGGSLTAYWETEARLQVPVTSSGRMLLNVAGRYPGLSARGLLRPRPRLVPVGVRRLPPARTARWTRAPTSASPVRCR